MNLETGGTCWFCQTPLTGLDYGRGDSCPKCGRDTHVCKGCIFYDQTAHNECREPQADRVIDKEKSNFCDYFTPANRPKGAAGENPAMTAAQAARAAAEALFKK